MPPRYRGASDQASPDAGRGAVAGWGRRRCDAGFPIGGPSRACFRRASPHAEGPLTAGRPRVLSEDAGPSARGPNGGVSRPGKRVRRDERSTTGNGAEQTYKHRARDAGDLADLRHYRLDKPRCREASRHRGSPGTLAFRAPSVLFGERRLARRSPQGRRRDGISDDGVPGAAKNTGGDACLFVIPGRAEGANPESREAGTAHRPGFRVRRKRAVPE